MHFDLHSPLVELEDAAVAAFSPCSPEYESFGALVRRVQLHTPSAAGPGAPSAPRLCTRNGTLHRHPIDDANSPAIQTLLLPTFIRT